MNEWIQRNAWSLAIAFIGIAVSFSLYGYRIDVVEKKVADLQTESTKNQILLEGIRKDIEYIRIEVTKLAK